MKDIYVIVLQSDILKLVVLLKYLNLFKIFHLTVHFKWGSILSPLYLPNKNQINFDLNTKM